VDFLIKVLKVQATVLPWLPSSFVGSFCNWTAAATVRSQFILRWPHWPVTNLEGCACARIFQPGSGDVRVVASKSLCLRQRRWRCVSEMHYS